MTESRSGDSTNSRPWPIGGDSSDPDVVAVTGTNVTPYMFEAKTHREKELESKLTLL